MEEIWKNVVGYEGLYMVSNFGEIISIKRNVVLKPSINHKGYCHVVLSKQGGRKTLRVHRLVAQAFIPNLENKPQVNHIDCDKQNNSVINLEWVTNGENQLHAWSNGLQKDVTGHNNPKARKINQYDINGNHIKTWKCIKDICDELHVHRTSIHRCLNGKYKTSCGYIWKYANK